MYNHVRYTAPRSVATGSLPARLGAVDPSGRLWATALANSHTIRRARDERHQQIDPAPGPRRHRSEPRRLGPQGDPDRRDRDARSHGHPRGIREPAAPAGRPHHRLAPHDDPDRGPHRDPGGSRRRRALGLLQHLLDPGPRRRRDRGRGHRGVRAEGRIARGVLGLLPPHLRVARQRLLQHDPGRRRRRHPAAAPGRGGGEGRLRHLPPGQRGRDRLFASIRRSFPRTRPGTPPGPQDPRRSAGDHHRGQAPLPDGQGGGGSSSRPSTSTTRYQEQVRQPLRLSGVVVDGIKRAHRRHGGGQGRGGVRLRTTWAGLRPRPPRAVGPGLGHRGRPDLRAAGRDGRLRRWCDGGGPRSWRTSSGPPPANTTSSPTST